MPRTTGAAMSRRVRRRRLADAFEREERTFGPDTDPERMERFLEWGRKTGGAARRLAEEGEASIGMALPWPIHRGHLDVEAWTEVQNLSLENSTQLTLVQKKDAGYLTLLTKLEGTRAEQKEAMMRVFWFLFEKTAERVEVGIRQYVRNCEYRALKKGTEIVFLEKHQQMLIHLCSYFFIKLSCMAHILGELCVWCWTPSTARGVVHKF